MDPVILTTSAGVAWLRFNRPERLNALDPETTAGFLAAVDAVIADLENRVLVLSGVGRAFVAGGDLEVLHRAADKPAAARALIAPMHEGLRKLRDAGVLTIAGVNGVAAGAGMSLALLADFAIATSGASFSMAYIGVGASPDCGGSWALARLVGRRRALELSLLSTRLGAEDAFSLGLVNRVVEPEALEPACQALADRLIALPWAAAMATCRLIDDAPGQTLSAHLDAEMAAFVDASAGADFAEAVDAFLARRTPRFARARH